MLGALFPSHPKPAPTPDADTTPPLLPGMVALQPVYNAQIDPCAHEYALRAAMLAGHGAQRHYAHFDAQLLQTLQPLRAQSGAGARHAYVRLLSPQTLLTPALRQLAPAQLTWLLDRWPAEAFTAPITEQLGVLKALGYRFALAPIGTQQVLPAPLLALADTLVFDLDASAKHVLGGLLGPLRQQLPHTPWYLRQVGSEEAFAAGVKAAANRTAHFHGPFFAQHRPQIDTRAAPGRLRVMEILRLLRAQAPVSEIERQFKLDSALLFKLLRYINAPANGLSRKIQTLDQTIQLMGRDTLFKWLTLLLFAAGDTAPGSLALMERALTRARLLENLGRVQGASRLECEHLFLTGLFSLLDALMGVPLAQAIAPLDLPAPIVQALQQERGLFAPHLALARALEAEDNPRISALCRLLSLSEDSVGQCALEAANWAQSVAAGQA